MNNDAIQQLAEQFISLWQRQLSQVVRDQDFMQTMFSSMQQFGTRGNEAQRRNTSTDADDDGVRGHELDFRLRQMDERIRELEHALLHAKPKAAERNTRKAPAGARRNPAKKRS